MTSAYQAKKELHTKFCDLLDDTIVAVKKQKVALADWDELYFAETMLTAINMERSLVGKPPIEKDLVVRIERTALGHVDYVEKFALYCVELVFDTSPLQAPR